MAYRQQKQLKTLELNHLKAGHYLYARKMQDCHQFSSVFVSPLAHRYRALAGITAFIQIASQL
ncbi:hypothetical protein ALP59_100615 [Pseudomonas savastanoi]|uniref:Uncharacterized protein n=1 Tax=Pseudomonas savastanoi TaxID=29438 RepID=A0A3M5G7J9_PSESS|nr:hypothetical protein ALP59_100615 [Pseudomonas savastanoi]